MEDGTAQAGGKPGGYACKQYLFPIAGLGIQIWHLTIDSDQSGGGHENTRKLEKNTAKLILKSLRSIVL